MAYLGSWKINDYVPIVANTHRFDTGAATDASSITYRIYEDETDTEIVSDTNMTKFDSNSGVYLDRCQLAAATGFEKGKCYTVLIKATVNGVAGTISHTFQIEAEASVNSMASGVVTATAIASDAITAAKIADNAITDAKINSGAITSAKFAAGAINAAAIAANAITDAKINDGALTAAKFAANSLTASALAADAGAELGTAVWATAARTLTAATNITSTGGTTVPQTGDSFARLGAPAGDSVSADIAAIEAQTDDIGVAGAGLTALASAANLAIVAGYLDTEIAAIKAKTDALPASPAAVGSAMTLANDAVSADALSAAAVDKILDEVVEGQGSITLRQSLMAILAFAAGQASGGGTTECVFESPNGVATRITMTVNSAGDRSAVTLNFA